MIEVLGKSGRRSRNKYFYVSFVIISNTILISDKIQIKDYWLKNY